MKNGKLTSKQQQELVATLRERFAKNMQRHKQVSWNQVQQRLDGHSEKLWSLYQMELTGGEPDVTGADKKSGSVIFMDCAPESPKGRRSVCYDMEALESRKEHKPKHSAMGMAEEMGVTVLNEEQYRGLQELGEFDTKTSSWIETPAAIRKLGGAVFGDRRYDQVFIYHNGAESYYAARGFRSMLTV